MPYSLTDYSNKKIGNGITISDYSVDTTTLLDIVGKGNTDYSTSIFENFIYLLSNYSSPFPPGTNFATNYQNNNNWLPTISSSASSTMETTKTILPGTLWYQIPEFNICSNSVASLIKGCIELPSDSTLTNNLNDIYDPNNYFTNNSDAVYGQELSSSGVLWIYTGKNASTTVSPNMFSVNGNLYATYDPALLGWEAYSTITVSTEEPSNRYAIWLNMNDSNFYYYNNSTINWSRIGTPPSIEPTEDNTGVVVSDGTLWARDGQLWMRNNDLASSTESYPPLFQNNGDSSTVSDGWILIGPNSPIPDKQVSGTTNGFNGTDSRYAVLIDSSGNNHDNILWFDGGILIAIVSKDEFIINSTTPILGGDTISPSITGFQVYPGINLVSSNYYFNGNIIADGSEYATKAYVDEMATGGSIGYIPVQQGGGTNMSSSHVYIGESTDGNSLLAQVGSQQLGSFAFENWVNSNYLSLTGGGVVSGAVSLNGGSTAVTVSFNDNSNNIATTAFVNSLLQNDYLPLSGGTLLGNLNLTTGGTSITPSTGDNSTNIATTAFVKNSLNSYVPTSPTTDQVSCTNLVYSKTHSAPYFISSEWSGELMVSGTDLGYLPTEKNINNVGLINSTIDTTYTLPTIEDSNGNWYILPDIKYILNNFSNYIKKTGDTATGLVSFTGGATVPTLLTSDNSTNVASTAYVKNNIKNMVTSVPTSGQLGVTNITVDTSNELIVTDTTGNTTIYTNITQGTFSNGSWTKIGNRLIQRYWVEINGAPTYWNHPIAFSSSPSFSQVTVVQDGGEPNTLIVSAVAVGQFSASAIAVWIHGNKQNAQYGQGKFHVYVEGEA